jgi:hypothetical protein
MLKNVMTATTPNSVRREGAKPITPQSVRREGAKPLNAPIKSMTAKDILEKINQYLPIREIEKNRYGEVFTPVELIEEMLDQLPKTVWSNPNLKWLDPANGIGNFLLVIYQRLLRGLKKKMPDIEQRREHILNNMLYMVEINPKNIVLARRIFGKTANISCADFLNQEDKWVRDFKGVKQFDIVIGNPPFQAPVEGKREGGYGGRTLWDKFVETSWGLVKENGYVGFIHPANWRGLGPNNTIWQLLRMHLIYLHIFGKRDGMKWFNASTRFDLYVASKITLKEPCVVIDEVNKKHNLKMTEWSFLPNYNFKDIKKLLTKREENSLTVMYSSSIYDTRKKWISEKQEKSFIYPVVHSMTMSGLQFWYTNDPSKGHFGVPKVILNFNEVQYPYNDYKGEYGMSQIAFGIPITSKKEGDLILKAINTPEFKEIIKATKWGAFQTDYRMFNYFKKDFYTYFI